MTDCADLNELAMAYCLNGEQWWSPDAESQFTDKALRLRSRESRESVQIQVERGRAQSECLRAHWLMKYHRPLKFTTLHWCARNVRAVVPDASADHPADIMMRLPDASWFGVSLKSRSGAEASGLKNPGLGTLEHVLAIKVTPVVNKAVDFMVAKWHLPTTQDARKAAIRANSAIQAATSTVGTAVLQSVRNTFLWALHKQDDEAAVRALLSTHLLDCGVGTLPTYVRIMGTGNPVRGYAAKLFDPYAVNLNGRLTSVAVGKHSIGFACNESRLCVLRAKWESEPLASTLKFSVDHWI